MKLFYAPASPYARKVRTVIREKGLLDSVEEILCNPFDNSAELWQANPLGKIPTLITPEGEALFDSVVICEYLDCYSPEPLLIPAKGNARWQILRWSALADGMMDSAYNIVMERRREEQLRSQAAVDRWWASIDRSISYMERDVISRLPQDVSLAHIALGVALGYMDFRLPDLAWRDEHKEAAAWFDAFADHPSMKDTAPKG